MKTFQRIAHTRGISLIELMISISLGLIIISGLTHTYLLSKTNHQLQTTLSTLHNEGHHALTQIIHDIQNAGYLAHTRNSASIKGTSPPILPNSLCKKDNQWARMLAQPVFGINDAIKTHHTIDYRECINNSYYLRGDILALRFASQHTVPTSETTLEENRHRLYLASIPRKSLLFQGQEQHKNKFLSQTSSLHSIQGRLYYIGEAINDTRVNCPTDNDKTYPALFRMTLNKKSVLQRQELSQGIENMQIQYGIDHDNNQSSDFYTNASSNTPWEKVSSIRVWLLIRAECPEAGFTNRQTYFIGDQKYKPEDHYRRLLLTSTVAINHHGID